MMKIPTHIRIGGVEYEVKTNQDALNDGTNMLMGEINYHNSTIRLSKIITGRQMMNVILWHEILHGIIEHMGIEIENEEKVVETFARGIYQVLEDNKDRFFDVREGRKVDNAIS